jgi:drug/metabolite transporter (DMT)-like permease
MIRKRPGEGVLYGLMTLTALFWAGAFIGGKIGVREFPPFSLTFFRFLLATLLIFPVMIRLEPKTWKVPVRDLPIVLFLGLTGMFGYHVLFFFALKYTTAINTSLISSTSPVTTTLLASLLVGETLGWKRLGAVLLAFFGVVLTVSNGNWRLLSGISSNAGDFLMIAASVCKAMYIITSRKFSVRYSPVVLTAYSFVVCLIISFPFCMAENPAGYLPRVTWQGWLSIAYMGIFASCIGYLAQQLAIKSIGASKTTAFENLVPVFTIALSSLILGESVTAIKVVSAVLIVAGVYWNSKIC